MKIEFGCGNKKPKKGFIGCDLIKNKHVKIVCPTWEINKFVEKESVEEIYSRMMFEHLTFAQGKLSLKKWYEILIPGGRVHLIMPDLYRHCEQIVNNKKNYSKRFGDAKTGIFGWQKENWGNSNFTAINNLWDVHKSGYDFDSLSYIIKKCGYKNIKRLSDEKSLEVEFFK